MSEQNKNIYHDNSSMHKQDSSVRQSHNMQDSHDDSSDSTIHETSSTKNALTHHAEACDNQGSSLNSIKLQQNIQHININQYRSHSCGYITTAIVDKIVTLSGWIHRIRDHGGVLFIDLRDESGIVQCVASSQDVEELSHLSLETVINISGKVIRRSENTINPDMKTGKIEVIIDKYIILSPATVIPFSINSNDNAPEEMRLKYRFLDLRRQWMHDNIILRSQVTSYIRQRMTSEGFLEIQTPILTASSPEGARDFLVPSRMHKGMFYALPQAPQQFKQLLMASGFNRYFQIAPCFRDEDSRADRSPGEFYQLDIEMSFVTQEDVFNAIEPIIYDIFSTFSHKKVVRNFQQIKYDNAIAEYGSDKPDLRNPLKIFDASDVFSDSEFSLFSDAVANGKVVKAICVNEKHAQDMGFSDASMSRKFFDNMNAWARENGLGGLGYIVFTSNEVKGPIASKLSKEKIDKLRSQIKKYNADISRNSDTARNAENAYGNSDENQNVKANINSGASENGIIFFMCGENDFKFLKTCGNVRTKLGNEFNLIDENEFRFCWIVDFPFYEQDDNGKIEFSHNPFSMPQGGMNALLNEDPLKIKAYQYDICCNGVELSSGAIRNHSPEIMYKAFEIAEYSQKETDEKFGGMINAFKYGVPPHGGIAPGLDRIIMLLTDSSNLREIIAFPLNQSAKDLMMGAPAEVSDENLKLLGIKITK